MKNRCMGLVLEAVCIVLIGCTPMQLRSVQRPSLTMETAGGGDSTATTEFAGRTVVDALSHDIPDPLKDILRETDDDLDLQIAFPKVRANAIGSKASLADARNAEKLALEGYDQQSYAQSAHYFLEAAAIYHHHRAYSAEKRVLLAGAEMQLKEGDREGFVLTIARYKALLEPYEIPQVIAQLLVNLADQMSDKPLTYPVHPTHKIIFSR